MSPKCLINVLLFHDKDRVSCLISLYGVTSTHFLLCAPAPLLALSAACFPGSRGTSCPHAEQRLNDVLSQPLKGYTNTQHVLYSIQGALLIPGNNLERKDFFFCFFLFFLICFLFLFFLFKNRLEINAQVGWA